MKRHFTKIVIIVLCLGLVSSYIISALKGYKKSSDKQIPETEIAFKKEGELTILGKDNNVIKHLDIEIANNSYETATGLMYRNSMQENQGMLFVFKQEAVHAFYMKNTRIPLDIIYINKDFEIVSFAKDAIPFDETSLPSKFPVQYVLEVNGGMIDKWDITEGDKITYQKIQ